jgi:hypothetical protein
MGSKNQVSSTSGSSNGTSTTTLSPQVQAAYNSLLSQIGGSASGTNAATNAATSGFGTLASGTNANYGSAATTLAGATAPASASINDYLSPYLTGALQAQIASQNQQNGQQQQGVIGNAIAQGALGGNRVGVAQSELAGQQALANNQANSSLINSAYQQAANAALQGQANQTAAGTAQGNLGSQEVNSSLGSLEGLLSAGNSQYGNLGTLAGAAGGLSNDGATTTSSGSTNGTATTPGPSLLSQLLGVATTAAGFFADGGVVPRAGYDGGGVVAEQALERANGVQGAQADSAAAIQALQQLMQQQSQDQQTTAPTNRQSQGMSNIRGMLFPSPAASAGVAQGQMAGVYQTGGVVRGYAPGGYVSPPSSDGFDLGNFLSSLMGGSSPHADDIAPDQKNLLDQIAPTNDNTPPPDVPLPKAVNSGVVPGFGSVGLGTDTDPVAAISPRLPQGMTRTDGQGFAIPGNVVPMMRAPAAGVVPSQPVPLAPLPSGGGNASLASFPSIISTGTSRASRNNNPGNIVASAWTAKQPGFTGTDGNFAVFDTPEAGQRAMDNLLSNYQDSGVNTISGIVGKWSPASANPPGSTANYINYVANRTGLDPSQPVTKDQIPAIANAMSEFESGNRPSNGTALPATSRGVVAVAPDASPSGVLASDMGFGRAPGPNPENGSVVGNNGAGYNPSQQDSPSIGGVISSLMAGKGTGLSDNMRAALISAGLGMMAGTSPFPLVNIGTGGQAGLKTYQDLQNQNREQAATQADIAQRAAEAARTGVATANEATTYAPAGIGMIRKTVNPDGTVTMERVPYSSIPVAGNQPSQGGGVGASGAPGATVAPGGIDPNGFVLAAPDMTSQLPSFANTDAGAKELQAQGIAYTEPAQADAMAAHKLDLSLAQLSSLADSLQDSGALTQGAGFGSRTALANSINTAFGVLGIKPAIDPSKVSTAEDVNKLATQLQAAVATSWKTDPAASTIMQAGTASPSGENTKQGFKRIVANIQAVNKRAVDRAAFLTSWQNQNYGVMSTANGQTADDVFNQLNPPSKYVDYGEKLASAVTPKTQADIDRAPKGTVFNINGTLMVK